MRDCDGPLDTVVRELITHSSWLVALRLVLAFGLALAGADSSIDSSSASSRALKRVDLSRKRFYLISESSARPMSGQH